jgi:hypothetical protein
MATHQGPRSPLGPTGTRPTGAALKPPKLKRRTFTDLGAMHDVVLPSDATLRGEVMLDGVALEGPLTLDTVHGTLTDVWATGRWAIDPATLPPGTPDEVRVNMQGDLNRKALHVIGPGDVTITRMRLENNDDVLAAGGGGRLTVRHSSIRNFHGFVGTHRDLIDLDTMDALVLEDCDLHHDAHCLLWCDSEVGLNPSWGVGSIELRRCKMTCDHEGPGTAPRQVHLDARVRSAVVESCLFDARPPQSLNVEDPNTLQVERDNVYWNDSGKRKAGQRIQVTHIFVAE